MSLLASLLRLRADASGHAIRTSHVRHLHLSDQPLMMLPLKRTGPAARPLAVMLGTSPLRPRLLIAPPSGSTATMLTALAKAVIGHVASHHRAKEYLPATATRPERARYLDAPQLVVPNQQAVRFLRTLASGLRLRRLDDQSPSANSIRLLGQWLTHFTDRAQIPGSAALVSLTDLLVMHWITGQSPQDDDLATLLAWIYPPFGSTDGRDAARHAEAPDTYRGAGPDTDAAFDNEKLTPLVDAYARDPTPALQELEKLLAAYLQPTWDRLWQAYALLQAIPPTASAGRRWAAERAEFTDHTTHLDQDGRPRPARDQAVSAAISLERREAARAAFNADRALEDPFVRVELRTTGDAVGGTVIAVDDQHTICGPGGRDMWRPRITLSTQDPVHLEPGRLLTSHLHRTARYQVRGLIAGPVDTLVELEITAGMGTVDRPNHTVLPSAGAFLVLTAAPEHFRMPAFPSRDQTPWTHGGPPPEHLGDGDGSQEEQ
ncbi:hypothetical protein [Streptomyces montanisoli]|uniref:Uncharacterized protein n=1 Tax=Streptomyces montanisoli TaxID=2798581 RepID=A0A940MI32_9ACTN|nr:hypothetical protein [Streptomyces montanisoli]MBP0458973.1 hypothetical protein [Streptomyces montanisoli]